MRIWRFCMLIENDCVVWFKPTHSYERFALAIKALPKYPKVKLIVTKRDYGVYHCHVISPAHPWTTRCTADELLDMFSKWHVGNGIYDEVTGTELGKLQVVELNK